jgi:acyl-CoA reductase-like NAD-dependent aldehyde dehydrogenase
MAGIDHSQLDALVEKVVEKIRRELGDSPGAQAAAAQAVASHAASSGKARAVYSPGARSGRSAHGRRGVFDTLDDAVAAAGKAFEEYQQTSLETRYKIIANMRRVILDRAAEWANASVQETGLGRVEDKLKKNILAAAKTPGPEILRPVAMTGDHGLTLHERAPFGVIGSITPSTNPTETVTNNAISMLSGGNTVVFNVHPGAKKVSRKLVEEFNDAIVAAGGPENCVTCIAEPTLDSAQGLMKHPGIRVIVVTGGGAVVKAAMSSGKRAICAGPGNPPVVVDETADLEQAGRDVVLGASFDNNIICIVEKELFVVDRVADELKRVMLRSGAYELNARQLREVEKAVIVDDHPNRDFVGKNAAVIAKAAGITVPEETRLLIAEVDEMHPLVQIEQLMPVFPMVRVRNVEEAIAAAVRAEHGFFHTAVMHSRNIDHLSEMASRVNTSIFIKNGPAVAGLGYDGEGHTAWTIAGSSGDGLTTALTYTRERRCTMKEHFRIV